MSKYPNPDWYGCFISIHLSPGKNHDSSLNLRALPSGYNFTFLIQKSINFNCKCLLLSNRRYTVGVFVPKYFRRSSLSNYQLWVLPSTLLKRWLQLIENRQFTRIRPPPIVVVIYGNNVTWQRPLHFSRTELSDKNFKSSTKYAIRTQVSLTVLGPVYT